MKQTKAPASTPSPKQGENKLNTLVDKTANPGSAFISLALDMSWRLAIVVLVPVVGGFELDKKLNTAPLLTIVGFVFAMVGMALVLRRMLIVANAMPIAKKENHS